MDDKHGMIWLKPETHEGLIQPLMSFCSNLIRRHQRRLRPFFCEKPLFKNTFQILSQKNAQIVNLKNPDLDLIRRIHPACGLYEFMIRFWICPKTLKIRFWIRKSVFGFSRKKAPLHPCLF